MKVNKIYQYQSTPDNVSSSRMKYTPCGVYCYLKSIRDGIARCKIVHIHAQPPTGKKFKLQQWVYIPVANLVDSDLYPFYTSNVPRWLKLVNQPVLASGLEILKDISEKTATQIEAAIDKRDIKIGQVYETSNNSYTIEKKWDQYFIVKNKYGDRQRYTKEELGEILTKEKAKLKKTTDWNAVLKAVGILLAPYMGVVALASLLKILEGILKK